MTCWPRSGVQLFLDQAGVKAAVTAAMTSSQLWPTFCRYNVSERYQGLVLPSANQCHNGLADSRTEVGTPKAPAKWAVALEIVTM